MSVTNLVLVRLLSFRGAVFYFVSVCSDWLLGSSSTRVGENRSNELPVHLDKR